MVRNPDKAADLRQPNVELVQGDLDDPASLDNALQGVDRAFIVAPQGDHFIQWHRNFIEVAKRAGNPLVVRLSALGAGDPDSEILRRHGQVDQLLRESGLPWTILQPNSFYQNVFRLAGTIKQQGAFHLPIGDGRLSMVDVRDIAAVAAEALTGTGHEGKTYEITGPAAITYDDIAATLSQALGREIRYVPVPPEAAKQNMLQLGMPERNAAMMAELYGVFATSRYAFTTDVVARITGRPPLTFEQFARDFAGIFR
jgi:uncharacterized protein YbjT (DUF2867 family)